MHKRVKRIAKGAEELAKSSKIAYKTRKIPRNLRKWLIHDQKMPKTVRKVPKNMQKGWKGLRNVPKTCKNTAKIVTCKNNKCMSKNCR